MTRFPNQAGTFLGLAVAPRIWPVHRTHILCHLTAKDAEIVVKMLPSRSMEVLLRYRNGAHVTVTSCPLSFDNRGNAANRNYKVAVTWHGSSLTVVAGGRIIATTETNEFIQPEKIVVLKSEYEIRTDEQRMPLPEGAVIRGLGKVGAVPEAFYAAKEELERARRQLEILETGTDLAKLSDAWKAFLEAFVQTRNKLLGATRAVATSAAEANTWSGVFEALRRDSVLLSYLHHARNAQSHGLGAILSKEDANICFRSDGVTSIKRIVGTKNGIAFEFTGTPPSIAISPHSLVALPVVDNGITYRPPEGEIGLFHLAQGGLVFLEEWLESGAATFG